MKIQVNNIHSVNSLSLIKLLKDLKSDRIEVVGSDVLPKGEYAGSLLVDKYYIAPPVSEENNYLAFLNHVFQKERIDLLIPASDAEALFLSKYKEKIDVPFFLADESTVKFFKDKLICSQKLSEQGVLVPPIITDLRNENKIIFRKRVSVNSQGIYIVDLSKETYIKNYFNNDYFIQKYIDGETFIVDVLSDINGVPHIIIPHYPVMPVGNARDSWDTNKLNVEELKNTMQRLQKKSVELQDRISISAEQMFMSFYDDIELGCEALNYWVYIAEDGRVSACACADMSNYNIKNTSFIKIWRESDYFENLRSYVDSTSCKKCNDRKYCTCNCYIRLLQAQNGLHYSYDRCKYNEY